MSYSKSIDPLQFGDGGSLTQPKWQIKTKAY